MRNDALLAQARALLIGHMDRPRDVTRAKLESWRRISAEHESALSEVEADWEALSASAPAFDSLRSAETDALYLKVKQGRRARALRRAGLGSVVVLALGFGLWLEKPHPIQDLMASHISPRATRETIRLADGTEVLLDADSAIRADIGPDHRIVRLLRGTAHFEVTHTGLPFTVRTDQGDIRVLGTGFDVRLEDGAAVVTLEHGKVAVAPREGAQAILSPGQQIALSEDHAGPARTVDLDEAQAWQSGRLVFTDRPLSQIAEEIGRYRKGRVVVASKALGAKRVTGSFSLEDTDAALASLSAGLGFRLTRVSDRLVILSP